MPKSLIAAIALLLIGGALWWVGESHGADLPQTEDEYIDACIQDRIDSEQSIFTEQVNDRGQTELMLDCSGLTEDADERDTSPR